MTLPASTPPAPAEPGPRCAAWARSVGVVPVGTAPAPVGWLFVGWPLPWPRDAGEVEPLAPVHRAAAVAGLRVQLVVPQAESSGVDVVVHRRPLDPAGWFAGFTRTAVEVAPTDLVEAAVALASSDPGPGPVEPGPPEPGPHEPDDVLVCTHGARDRCCGSDGTALALEAAAAGVPVRRTSHLGGHRFAATAVLLPSGTAWADLDAATLAGIVARTIPVEDVLDRYRGSAGFSSPAHQAAEREAFRVVGWPWLGWRRRALDFADGAVRIEAVDHEGGGHAWEVSVTAGRTLPVPECGQPVERAKKSETEVLVTSVRRLQGEDRGA